MESQPCYLTSCGAESCSLDGESYANGSVISSDECEIWYAGSLHHEICAQASAFFTLLSIGPPVLNLGLRAEKA